ncbi:TspO/MBR family protein [Streptomyces globosus]|uniref:TspO/MBR family protein n=1 Tax=Streptomyces globosus TaxID=68209 RepID=UPI0031D29A64
MDTAGARAAARRPLPLLLVLLAATYGVAAVGALAGSGSREVYASLQLPAWAPPSWLFGPVWTVLYASIAVAAWLVVRRGRPELRRPALLWWSAQLLLNLAWTPLFFTAGRYGLAFAEICMLLAAVVATIAVFAKAYRPAALLLVPYALWVAFATTLNASIWLLNP